MPQSFLFRGTTINYKGNNAAIAVPYTCTSRHPVKALWFALECVSKNPASAVVYLAKAERLLNFEPMGNWLESVEDEVAFRLKPLDFYPLTEGYIHTVDFQKVLFGLDIDTYKSVRKDNLTLLCENTEPLKESEIDLIVEKMEIFLKK